MLQSEARFRRLVKVAPIPLCYVAKGAVIQDFNDRFAQVFGYTHEDIPTMEEWWQLAYPGQIRVAVVRETRAVDYAK